MPTIATPTVRTARFKTVKMSTKLQNNELISNHRKPVEFLSLNSFVFISFDFVYNGKTGSTSPHLKLCSSSTT